MLKKLINAFNGNGTKFVGFTYTNKQDETSRYVIQVNTDEKVAIKKDLVLVPTLEYVQNEKFDKETFETAKEEIVKSLKMSLGKLDETMTKAEIEKHQNRSNGQKNAYISIAPNVQYNVEKMNVVIWAKKHQKTVLVEGVYPIVNSSAKTIAKNAIKKHMKSAQYRKFIVPNIETMKVNGDIIEFA
jgi:hypothetical protein